MLKGKGLLTPLQREFLRLFAGLPDQERFYLTGGTALSEFYLGHRLSFDLDLFTNEHEMLSVVEAASTSSTWRRCSRWTFLSASSDLLTRRNLNAERHR